MSSNSTSEDLLPTRRVALSLSLFAGFSTMSIALAIALGALTGVGAYTFGYGEGLSYLSSDPTACTNCHVMQDYFDSWQQSSHHHVAVCVDCHLPHDLASKYLSKADNGFFHSLAFTLNNFHEPIEIKPRNARILQHNCVSCHREFVHDTLPSSQQYEELRCTHCHAGVGHG